MKKLPQFSVNYPITILMLVLAVFLLGYISFQKLGMDLFPDIKNPRIFVELKAGELPPEEIEQKYLRFKTVFSDPVHQTVVIPFFFAGDDQRNPILSPAQESQSIDKPHKILPGFDVSHKEKEGRR